MNKFKLWVIKTFFQPQSVDITLNYENWMAVAHKFYESRPGDTLTITVVTPRFK